MFDNFNKDVYLEALNILFWDSDNDDVWDEFVDKYNISPYDLILDLFSKYFNTKEELDSLHHAYNELNSQNEDVLKKYYKLKNLYERAFLK